MVSTPKAVHAKLRNRKPRHFTMSDTRSDTEWRLLMTVADAPTAAFLTAMLEASGIRARIASDAVVLGQAAPARIYVEATQLRAAEALVAWDSETP
jgi:hypothetical protein